MKKEIFSFLTLIAIFGLLCWVFTGHQGHPLIDTGREVYFPERVLNGEILFRDIFVLFGPLSYQINANLYKIFGTHINTLYFAGIANSFVILTVYYLIARKITSIKVSWLACFVLMSICIFSHHVSNYIFPYSYAMIYALSTFLISVLLSIYYIEKSKPVYLILAALFIGVSITSKLDFAVFFLALLAIGLFYKPLDKKSLILLILAFLLVPSISMSSLFLSGLKLNEFTTYFNTIQEFINSSFFRYFYQEHTGLYPTPKILWVLWSVIKIFLYNFSIIFAVFFSFFWIFSKIPGSKAKTALQIVVFLLLYVIFPKTYFKEIGNIFSLGWLAISTTLILLICLRDKVFALVAVAGIIAALKSYFLINLNIFGTYLVPLLILVNLVFIFDKVPEMLKFIPKKPWGETCFTSVFILSLVFMATNYNYVTKLHNYPIKTSKGSIYTMEKLGKNLSSLLAYIDTNVPGDKTFLVMPEGILFNFLTDRESDSWYHSFTPHFVDVFSEEKIIKNIKTQKPDYIFITNQETDDFKYKNFCSDYAQNICKYIQENYLYVQRLEKPGQKEKYLWVDAYRKK